MNDEFNKGFRRGYDAALQDLNAFLDLAGSIRRNTKETDSEEVLTDISGEENCIPDPLDGVCEPLESYSERYTCSQCSCWSEHLKSIFCMKTHRRVSDCDIACEHFRPKIKGEE